MTQEAALVGPGMQFILATRHLERIADHATNIAEDIIFWVRGLDVRHGRGLTALSEQSADTEARVGSQADISAGIGAGFIHKQSIHRRRERYPEFTRPSSQRD